MAQTESQARAALSSAERASLEPPHDCDESGHDWQSVGTAEDGTRFSRCRVCGKVDES